MADELINFLAKDVTRRVIPGIPGTPGTPETRIYQVETIVYLASTASGQQTSVDLGSLGPFDFIWMSQQSPGIVITGIRNQEKLVKVIPGTPSIPAVPERVEYDRNLGWNCTAVFAATPSQKGSYKFGLNSNNVGLLLGLTTSDRPITSTRDVIAGVQVMDGYLEFVCNGAIVGGGYFLDEYEDFEIGYDLSRGVSWIDAVTAGREVDATTETSGAYLKSMPRLYMQAAMYAGGDAVYGMDAQPGGDVQLKGKIALSGFSRMIPTPPEGEPAVPMIGRGTIRAYGSGLMRSTSGIRVPMVSGRQAEGAIQIPTLSRMRSGTLASQQVGAIAINGLAAGKAGYGVQRNGRISVRGVADGRNAGIRSIGSVGRVSSHMDVHEYAVIGMSSTGQLLSMMTAEVSDSQAFESVVKAMATMYASVTHPDGSEDEADEIWVVNLSTGESTRYTNYRFDGFAQIGDRVYGLRADGLYLLEGPTDAGKPIEVGIATGKNDFGGRLQKRVPYLYLDGSSSKRMKVRVSVNDGQTYDYEARRVDAYARNQRVDMGRGLLSNYYQYEIRATAEDFELNSIEMDVRESQRRI